VRNQGGMTSGVIWPNGVQRKKANPSSNKERGRQGPDRHEAHGLDIDFKNFSC
jgi:hypothetical protein